MAAKYAIGAQLKQVCALLGLSEEKVLRRTGLAASLAAEPDMTVEPVTYFRIWDAMTAEADRPGAERELAMAYAHGPFIPPVFAFSCAETLGLGLKRLSDFKPLIGPLTMDVTLDDIALNVTMRPADPDIPMSSSMGLFEILYMTECARTFTGTQVTPVAATLPQAYEIDDGCRAYLGLTPTFTGTVGLTFAAEDADLPLITRSQSLWDTLEPNFTEQLAQRIGSSTMSGRIKQALAEALPGGSTTVEDMARKLNVSKRSLQRRLTEEGTSFQALLNETRFEMSERYLKSSALSVPEISYLLGFRDTSSFFRAFHGWTGTTPGDYRGSGGTAAPERLN